MPSSVMQFAPLQYIVKGARAEKRLGHADSTDRSDESGQVKNLDAIPYNQSTALAETEHDEDTGDNIDEEVEGVPPSPNEVPEQKNTPDLDPPESQPSSCNMDTCFDYSLCPITERLRFYLYPIYAENNETEIPSSSDQNDLYSVVYLNEQRVDDPDMACIFIIIVDVCDESVFSMLIEVEFYNGGRNHVFWTYCSDPYGAAQKRSGIPTDIINEVVPSNFIFVTDALDGKFRPNFDILTGHMVEDVDQDAHSLLMPFRRNYLASLVSCDAAAQNLFSQLVESYDTIYRSLTEDECVHESLRSSLLQNSTFSFIILPPDDKSLPRSQDLQRQLHEILKHNVIPVAVGTRFMPPFNDVLDWSKVMITIPPGRMNEVHTILQSISDDDIEAFILNGRLLFDKYLSSTQTIAETVLGVLRTRIGLIPAPYRDVPSPSVYNDTFVVSFCQHFQNLFDGNLD